MYQAGYAVIIVATLFVFGTITFYVLYTICTVKFFFHKKKYLVAIAQFQADRVKTEILKYSKNSNEISNENHAVKVPMKKAKKWKEKLESVGDFSPNNCTPSLVDPEEGRPIIGGLEI